MSHAHDHGAPVSRRRLLATMVLNFVITLTELVGGVVSGSLSLVSDALHNFSDGISLILSYLAVRLRDRPNSARHTFGLKRAEILVAVINSSVLLAISVYLFYEAGRRLLHPQPVQGALMIAVAAVGLAANVVGTLLLRRDAGRSLNVRSAYLHLLSDAVSSVGVVLGGAAIYLWGVYWVDPVLSILIAVYVLRESLGILSQALHVLMEGAPQDLDLEAIQRAVEGFPEVVDLHHLHVWTVGEGDVHLEAHINIRDMRISEADGLRAVIEAVLHDDFGVEHATIQFECGQCAEVGLVR